MLPQLSVFRWRLGDAEERAISAIIFDSEGRASLGWQSKTMVVNQLEVQLAPQMPCPTLLQPLV